MAKFKKGRAGKGETDGIPEPDADDLPTSLRRKGIAPAKLENKAGAVKGGKPMPPWMKK